MSAFRPAGTTLNLPVGIVVFRTPVGIAATEKNVTSGHIHRYMQNEKQRCSGSGFLPEEGKLFRQNLIGGIVNHQNLKSVPVNAVRQRIASLIQGKKSPAGPFLPQSRFRSRKSFIMPVMISRDIEPGDSCVIQSPESKLNSGFGWKTHKVACNQDQIVFLLSGDFKRLKETVRSIRKKFRHSATVLPEWNPPRIIKHNMSVTKRHDPKRMRKSKTGKGCATACQRKRISTGIKRIHRFLHYF